MLFSSSNPVLFLISWLQRPVHYGGSLTSSSEQLSAGCTDITHKFNSGLGETRTFPLCSDSAKLSHSAITGCLNVCQQQLRNRWLCFASQKREASEHQIAFGHEGNVCRQEPRNYSLSRGDWHQHGKM